MSFERAKGLPVRPWCVTAACDLTCAWCECCGGPAGIDFLPGSPEQPPFPSDPTHFRLVGGDPFSRGDIAAWVTWARRNPRSFVTVQGHGHHLADPSALERLTATAPDAVEILLPALDDALLEAWTGAPLVASRTLDGIDAALGAGLPVSVVVALNAVTAPHLADTVTGLAHRFHGRVSVLLQRAPLRAIPGRAPRFDAPPWAELEALGDALSDLPSPLPHDTPLRFDPLRGYGPCVLPPAAWRPGLVTAYEGQRALETLPDPAVCEACAWRPRCAWRLRAGEAPTEAMRPLSAAQAVDLQGRLEVTQATRRAARRRGDLPDLLCLAPFTSLSIHELRKRPVPCAQSWVDTTSTPEMEAEILGAPVAQVEAQNRVAQERWGVPWHDVMNEDWPLREVWNAPLLRHMRRQMLGGGPSDRCRSSCRVVLGVEERGTPFLMRPDEELTPEVVANRRLLLDDIREGRDELRALPLDLCVGVSSHCNITCGFCTGPMGNFGELSDRRYDEVVSLLPTLMHLSVVGPGEPLMSPAFGRLLDHIRARGYPSLTLGLTTNGTLVRRGWVERYGDLPWSMIRVSLNAGSATTYERMTHKAGYFERVIEGLELLAAMRDRRAEPFDLVVSCVLSANVAGDLEGFADTASRLRARVVLEPMTGDLDGNSPYKSHERTQALSTECRAIAEAYAVKDPGIARAFHAMATFADERVRRRLQVILPRR